MDLKATAGATRHELPHLSHALLEFELAALLEQSEFSFVEDPKKTSNR